MGIIANIYRISNYPDCSNDGISNNFEEVCVVNCNGPFDFNEDRPPVILEKGQSLIKGEENVKAYPVDIEHYKETKEIRRRKEWHMFGGTYIGCSDGRFGRKISEILGRNVYTEIVPLHDRTEPYQG
tara:strand:- start:369 stop:749 length:381 start_codon:yes stop_codon:yes gene_type:complete